MWNPENTTVTSTSTSITVKWNDTAEDTNEDTISNFDIKFKESNKDMFTSIQVRKDDTSIEIDDLKPNTEYVVNIYICYGNGNISRCFETKYSTTNSTTSCLMEGAFSDKTQKPILVHMKPVVIDVHTLQHANIIEDDAPAIDRIRICDMISKRNPGPRQNEEKTVLLLGETGSGKSTLIDALMNFIAGVSYNDDQRLRLIAKTAEEATRENQQFESQTSSVTVYRIPKMEGLRVTCGVNIIDTPGYNDTRANFDKRITDQIKELFDKKIDHLDAILIVVPVSTTRLTHAQKDVFSNILKMFGDDIKENIFLATTFDDSGKLSCLDVLNKANVPHTAIFRFNNANLYSAFSSDPNQEELNQKFWKNRTTSFSDLFKRLESTKKTTLKTSKEVMKARHNLEIQLIALEDTLSKQAQDIVNYKEDKKVLDDINAGSPEDQKNSRYKRFIPEMKLQLYGKYSIICTTCKKTCHKNCWAVLNVLKGSCEAMSDGNCTVCAEKCTATSHEISKDEYVQHYVPKWFSGADVVNRQEKREESFAVLKTTLNLVDHLIKEINTKALQKDALTVEQYIEDLAKKEEKEKKQGYEMRTMVQRKIEKHLKQGVPIWNLEMTNLI